MIASMDIGFFELNNEERKIDVVVNRFENGGVRAAALPQIYQINTIDNEQMQPSPLVNSRKDDGFNSASFHCAFVHFYTDLHIAQCRYRGPKEGAQHGERNTQEIRHPARSKRIPSGGFTALPDHRACGKQRGDAQHGGYAGYSDDEGVSVSHADRDGHGKYEAACCGNRTQQQLSRAQKGAHERQQHPDKRAQRALHHMRRQFSQQTGKHCRAVPFAGPQTGQTARRCTAQEHRTQEQEHRCPHQIVKKTENMLFVHTSSPLEKS